MPLSVLPVQVTKFTQATAAATWTIVHNCNGYPILDVYVPTSDGSVQKIIPKAVTYVDANTVTVSFTSARSGFATILV